MQKLKELAEIVRSLLPKARNRLAAAMVYAGIAMILGPPLVEKLIYLFVGQVVETQLTEYDQIYGLILILWGSIYHLLMTKLSELSSAVRSTKAHRTRTKLIAECRKHLDTRNFDRRQFVETDIYSRLRPFLSDELKKQLEKNPNHITVTTDAARGGGVDNFKSNILDELTMLEREWGLL